MLKASGLRIGNIVWLKSKAKVWEILSGVEIDTGCDSEDFDPLKLEEHWILRFGFEWKNNGLRNKNICIRQFGSAYCLFLSNESLNFEKRLEYVHQLQNLYFALVGEELVLQD